MEGAREGEGEREGERGMKEGGRKRELFRQAGR